MIVFALPVLISFFCAITLPHNSATEGEHMSNLKSFLLSTATCLLLFPAIVFSQTKPEPKPSPAGEAQDVIKFETSLVQTDVMVFDKTGRFVDGLKPEQFQLKINNTPREISFFETITSRGASSERPERNAAQPDPVDALT